MRRKVQRIDVRSYEEDRNDIAALHSTINATREHSMPEQRTSSVSGSCVAIVAMMLAFLLVSYVASYYVLGERNRDGQHTLRVKFAES